MKDPTSVGLGEQSISSDPEDVLVAYGLGSCLGICMIDPLIRVSGLLHAVLPAGLSGLDRADSSARYKYVDSGIEDLVAAMLKVGANKSRLIVRIAGGANMLISTGLTSSFDIGTRNIEMARKTLQSLRMPITAEEVGGHTGRTVRVYVASSCVTVRVIGYKEHEI